MSQSNVGKNVIKQFSKSVEEIPNDMYCVDDFRLQLKFSVYKKNRQSIDLFKILQTKLIFITNHI